jgi:diphthine methyl ester synthase
MTLYLIGIGLYDEKDITLRGLEAVKNCDTIYLEHYTSILSVDVKKLEELYGKDVIIAPRDLVEKQAEEKLIIPAKEKKIALLVVGDPFGATTHTDLLLRAKEADVDVQIIFNASVLNAIGVVGLELYKYAKTTSIVFPDNNWLPHTPYDVIKENKERGLHTLCLLDIKVAEPSIDDLRRAVNGEQVSPSSPRFMTVQEGLDVLLRIEEERKENIISEDMLAIGIARLGHPDQLIVAGPISELLTTNFGKPLHCIVIPGKLHVVEEEALGVFE